MVSPKNSHQKRLKECSIIIVATSQNRFCYNVGITEAWGQGERTPPIFADQLDISRADGAYYAHLINTRLPRFSDFPPSLLCI